MAEKPSTLVGLSILLAIFAVVLTVPTEGKYDIPSGRLEEKQKTISKRSYRVLGGMSYLPLDKIGGGVVLREFQEEEPSGESHQEKQNAVYKRSYRVLRGMSYMPLDKIGGGVVLRELQEEPSEQPKSEQNNYVGSESLNGSSVKSKGKRKDANAIVDSILQNTFEEIDPYKFSKRNFDEIDRAGFRNMGKRNFDEIDRAGFRNMRKRNFDEIDRAGFRRMGKRNFDEIDRAGFRSMGKRNFDEIDRAGFRSMGKRNFDEIDRAGFRSMGKRNFDEIDRAGFHKLGKKNFDEIDRSGFSNIGKRVFDQIDTSEFSTIGKQTLENPEIPLPIIDKFIYSNTENNPQGMPLKGIGIENDNSIGKMYGMPIHEEGKRNFDEIDRSGFGNIGKRNFDEIDRSGFNNMGKRNFDEIDRAGFNHIGKRQVDKAAKVPFTKDYSSHVSENNEYGTDSLYNVAKEAIGSILKATTPKNAKVSSTTKKQ